MAADVLLLTRAWLLSSAAVTALCNQNIFAPELPPSFDTSNGNLAITLSVRGGTAHAEITKYRTVKIEVAAWASLNEASLARTLYGVIYDSMHDQNMVHVSGVNATVISSNELNTGIDETDQESGWQRCTGLFRLQIMDT